MISRLFCAILLVAIVCNLPLQTSAESHRSIQVGVRGDDASDGAVGARAEIRTHIYDADSNSLNYFWVGLVLGGDAFVQFGYALEPGYYCLSGRLLNSVFLCNGTSELLAANDARWEWQYWPNVLGMDYYYGIGPTRSAGTNGTWTQYSIMATADGNIALVLNQTQVAKTNFQLQPSEQPPMMVAEESTSSNQPGALGPVQFRNLSDLRQDGWHAVDSIISISGCGIGSSCNIPNPYGLSLVGPNDIIAGSGGQIQRSGQLLWTSGYVALNVAAHSNVQFHVSTILGDEEFSGSGTAEVPRGLFAYVTLATTSVQSNGMLGLMGAVDTFQGWTGSEKSSNQSLRVLMDQNETIQASWRTSYGDLILNIGIVAVIVAGVTIAIAVIALRSRTRRNETTT